MNDQPRIPTDVIREVFPSEVLERLRSVRNPSEDLKLRVAVLTVRESEPVVGQSWVHTDQKLKAAWKTYLQTAFAVGLFEGEHGKDLLGRMRSPKAENFRSAMAECTGAWFLTKKRNLTVEPRPTGRIGHPLEFCIRHTEGDIYVEVKAPYRRARQRAWVGDDSDKLQEALKSANKQFQCGTRNLLIIVPTLRISVFEFRSQIIQAFFGETAIKFLIDRNTGSGVGSPYLEFQPSGHFLKIGKPNSEPFFTRTSAVLCIEEIGGDRQIEYNALIVHNPHAQYAIPEALWNGLPQFVERGDEMVWTDGIDPL